MCPKYSPRGAATGRRAVELSSAATSYGSTPLPETPKKSFEELLTPAEASRLLKVSPRTMANWRSSGRGPEFVKLGDENGPAPVRYTETALCCWLAQQQRPAS